MNHGEILQARGYWTAIQIALQIELRNTGDGILVDGICVLRP